MLRLASIIADVLQEYFCVITVACGLVCRGGEPVALHPLCGAAPEQKRCNAYGSGALPLRTSESVVGVCRGDCVAQR